MGCLFSGYFFGSPQAVPAHKEKQNAHQTESEQKRLREGKTRLAELEALISSIYEDKVLGKIPETVCRNLPVRSPLSLLST